MAGFRTSLRYLGEGEASASLEVDVVGVNEGAQRPEWFAREEIYLLPLSQQSAHLQSSTKREKVGETNVFEILQEVGHCFPLDVGEDGLIQAIARPPYTW